MEIIHFTTDTGRDPIKKWYDGLDNSVKPQIDALLQKLTTLDMTHDAGFPKGITHLTHTSRDIQYKDIDIYEAHAGKLRIYFGVISEQIIILHVDEKGTRHSQAADIAVARSRYLECQGRIAQTSDVQSPSGQSPSGQLRGGRV